MEGITNVEISVRPDEGIERALRRFRREVRKANLLREIRERQYYRKPSEEKRLKARRAQRQRERDTQKNQERSG